ncbi:MAG: extracellular solute-binding protein [Oscillospiraceae bacterium]|nr:extracellular solute-binding protein [Oscillospiraceae bacterium]
MKKRLLAFILAAVMLLTLAACTGTSSGNAEVSADPLTKDDVIKVTIYSHASWPYNPDWVVWDYIEEAVGATLEINAIPSSDTTTKYPLMFASRDIMPDVATFDYKPDSDKYASQGALIAYEDVEQYMPNYLAWKGSLSENEVKTVIDVRKSADGKIYYSPATGREATTGMLAWLYRRDIFEKHGLSVPTTFDELYEVSKKLKEIYPDSYPFAMRSGMSTLGTTGSSWKEYWSVGPYYDFNNDVWGYGAREDITLEMIEFYKKMVAEKLMPADFFTINVQLWQELVTTDRGFIFPDFRTRITFFNSAARGNNPEFDLTAFAPPVANPETGVSKMLRRNDEAIGYVMCNTGDAQRIANAAKYLDWFYTDEAMELVSWGKEGETYNVENGKKVYIVSGEGQTKTTLYGINTHGTFLRYDPEAILTDMDAETLEVKELTEKHMLDYITPVRFLAFNDEEQRVIDEYATACTTYTEEMLAKFILGQEPVSNFDKFQETLDELGVQEVIKAYTTAYDRVK